MGCMENKENKWRYERGEGRQKHLWNKDYAGFLPGRRGPVGKCPCHITEKIAQRILNEEAVPVYDEDGQFPDRFYAVYKTGKVKERNWKNG